MQPEVTELTDEERRIYLKLQAKVGCRRTGTDIFESFFQILPMVACELAVVRKIRGVEHVFMWRRKDVHYDGWHMPGGYLFVGESDEEWIQRVLKKEANLGLENFHFIRPFNLRPETGWVPNHPMAHFFLCRVEGEPSVGQFFPVYPVASIPDDTLGHHKKYVDCLRAHFMRMETMYGHGIHYDYLTKAPEWKWRLAFADLMDYLPTHDFQNFDSLDSALEVYHDCKKPDIDNVGLYDDQGLQIL